MVVMDDPDSIVKCANKVYLAELFATHNIPCPKTRILQKGVSESVRGEIDFPVVLKIPDGSFSRGVYKANDEAEYKALTEKLFKESDLILAQEFLYTEFDWRIGILNNQPLYACQYFMSRKHWQIYKHDESGKAEEGGFKTWMVRDVPRKVVDTALSLARLIGDGLYGVDIKETPKRLRHRNQRQPQPGRRHRRRLAGGRTLRHRRARIPASHRNAPLELIQPNRSAHGPTEKFRRLVRRLYRFGRRCQNPVGLAGRRLHAAAPKRAGSRAAVPENQATG
ncbi:ATP-grasp domain-containing protein [Methylogaea oryzae]|uniref:ATP-grasp domain-containing protein n=1 Tax=Methylogaea oryzae TaxID=1295382 RepID=UPI000A53B826|nr:hypothetical protein [Methylogaea oryzae]